MILRERFCVTILIGAGLACLLAWLLPAPANLVMANETRANRFYLQKTHRRIAADIVVMGDSRVLRGVSPAAMEERLPGLRIFNFAYNAGSLNREMYAASEARLDPRSRVRTILIGVTPLALQGFKSGNEQYREYKNKPADDVFIKLRYPAVVDFFQTRRLSDLVSSVLDIEPHTYYEQEFHRNGWIGSDRRPLVPGEAFDLYKMELADHSISTALLEDMIIQTRDWTARGIRVLAFRPPTSPAMEALEDSLTGFDERSLVDAFQAAGGAWLQVNRSKYETYDGSHLRLNDAVEFSRDLASAVASHL